MLRALRQALCPLPPLTVLLEATSRGDLDLADTPRRKRQPQMNRLPELLRGWILG